MIRRRFWHGARLGLLLTGIAACNTDRLTIPNYNQPTTEGVGKDPNGVQLLVSGILAGSRNSQAGMVQDFGQFGREAYNYFATDGRFISNYLVGIPGPQRLDPAGFASGGWVGRYQNQRNAVQLVDVAGNTALSAEQKSAVSGFAKTYRALELSYVIMARDTLGAPVDIPADPNSPAPWPIWVTNTSRPYAAPTDNRFMTMLVSGTTIDLKATSSRMKLRPSTSANTIGR